MSRHNRRRRNQQPVVFSVPLSQIKSLTPPPTPAATPGIPAVPAPADAGTPAPATPLPTIIIKDPGEPFRPAAEMRAFMRGLERVRTHFVFSDDMTRDMFASTWLIKDASCVLKGSPGTGKTTLIQCGALVWLNHPERIWNAANYRECLKTLTDAEWYTSDKYNKDAPSGTNPWEPKKFYMPMIAMAKHNQDKEPDELFYYSDVATERRRFRGKLTKELPLVDGKASAPLPTGGGGETSFQGAVEGGGADEPPVTGGEVKVYKRNPAYRGIVAGSTEPKWIEFKDDHQYEGMDQRTDTLDVVRFEPKPYPIVDAVVKLENESNRMNPNVADTMLGMLAENMVEYRGKTFPSPKDGEGGLNFFDYNPHLDREGMEMDRALLDRVDLGLYLPGGDIKTRLQVVLKHAGWAVKGDARPEDKVFSDIKEGMNESNYDKETRIDARVQRRYLTARELRLIWRYIKNIPVTPEAMLWISYMSHLPNFMAKTYGPNYKRGDTPMPGAVDPRTGLMRYTDVTLTTYQEAIEGGDDDRTPEAMSIYNEMKRPFGFRSALSFIKVIKAYHAIKVFREYTEQWDRWYAGGQQGAEPQVPTWERLAVGYWRTDNERRDGIEELGEVLPYILDHRVNIGVSKDFMREYNSFFDFVKYEFVGKLIHNNLDEFSGYLRYIANDMEAEIRKKYPKDPGAIRNMKYRMDAFRKKYDKVFGKDYAEHRTVYLEWFLELAATPLAEA